MSSLNFYPNPASTNGTVEILLAENAKMELVVINSVGQVVYTTAVNGFAGSNKVNIDDVFWFAKYNPEIGEVFLEGVHMVADQRKIVDFLDNIDSLAAENMISKNINARLIKIK